jgi:hypothetical protein
MTASPFSKIIEEEFERFRMSVLNRLDAEVTIDPDDIDEIAQQAKTDLKAALEKHFGVHVASTVTSPRFNPWNFFVRARTAKKRMHREIEDGAEEEEEEEEEIRGLSIKVCAYDSQVWA